MADPLTKIVWFSVKRLDKTDIEAQSLIPVIVNEEDKVSHVSQNLHSKLHLNGSNLILRLRNEKGSFVPLNGKIVHLPNSNARPFTLEVVKQFQSVQPKPNSLELTQYAESIKNKLHDIQKRISDVELSLNDLQERRTEKIEQEMLKLDNTITFLKKRLEEAETIEWRGMFVKNPLW